jgi:RNA polymerase sigma-70 factor (ECF subfamily)
MDAHLRSVPASSAEGAVVRQATSSFEEFYEANFQRVFSALCLVTGNRNEAEEIAQDGFLKVLERWDRVVRLEDPTGYLFRVSMNVFRKRYRRATLALRRTPSPAPAETDELSVVETRDEVVRLLEGLSPQQRAAILLTAILDYTAEEAGGILHLRASSVRSLTARARAQMKGEVAIPNA